MSKPTVEQVWEKLTYIQQRDTSPENIKAVLDALERFGQAVPAGKIVFDTQYDADGILLRKSRPQIFKVMSDDELMKFDPDTSLYAAPQPDRVAELERDLDKAQTELGAVIMNLPPCKGKRTATPSVGVLALRQERDALAEQVTGLREAGGSLANAALTISKQTTDEPLTKAVRIVLGEMQRKWDAALAARADVLEAKGGAS